MKPFATRCVLTCMVYRRRSCFLDLLGWSGWRPQLLEDLFELVIAEVGMLKTENMKVALGSFEPFDHFRGRHKLVDLW